MEQIFCWITEYYLEKRGTPPDYPIHVKPKDVDSIIITHAHLDHSGNVPSMFVSGKPMFMLLGLLWN